MATLAISGTRERSSVLSAILRRIRAACSAVYRALHADAERRAAKRVEAFIIMHGGGVLTPEIERNLDAIASGKRDIRTFSPRFPKV